VPVEEELFYHSWIYRYIILHIDFSEKLLMSFLSHGLR
jgi:hypothetical protein